MPDLSEAEIRAKTADGTIFGLSIDTALFDKPPFENNEKKA